jgi:hypothetical protein
LVYPTVPERYLRLRVKGAEKIRDLNGQRLK